MKAAAAFFCLALASAEQLPLKTYTTAEGLAHNHINAIRQDPRGFLWFCTDEGLSRFDGYQFTNYTTREGLPHPWVNDLLVTRDGAYWVATDGGVSRFNPAAAVRGEPIFVTYLPDQRSEARRVNALAEDVSGAIWCATYNGLYRLDRAGESVKFQFADMGLPENEYEGRLVNNLMPDSSGPLWLAARAGLYRRWSDGRIEHYTRGLPDQFIETVFQDRQGRRWIGTRNGGLCSMVARPLPGHTVVERCYSTVDGLPAKDVRSIFQSSDGKMWIGTTAGLSEFDPTERKGQVFKNYSTANGLSQMQIYRLAEDRDGNLWIGTRSGGLMKLVRHGFASYREADGFIPGSFHHRILETTSGKLCVLSTIGRHGFIQILTGERFSIQEINLKRNRGGTELEDGFQDRTGEWWFVTRQGLVRFPGVSRVEDLGRARATPVYSKPGGLAANSIHHLFRDAPGGPWIVTICPGELRLSRWDRSRTTLSNYAAAKGSAFANGGVPSALAEDASGNVWIGFRDHGTLLRYHSGRFEPFLAESGTVQGGINALHLASDGRLWIASSRTGLIRVDDPGSDRPRIVRYTAEQGLSSNEILCLTEDQWGRLYVGSNRGIDRLDPGTGSVRHYSTADGLPAGSVWDAYRSRQGILWFVSDRGVSYLVPAPEPATFAPPVLIRRLWAMGIPQPVSELGETRVDRLRLMPGQNQVRIEFVGLDFRSGDELRYQYKLEGADREWSPLSGERTVLYAHLASGTYRFLVRAVSSDGVASAQPAVVSFTVPPHVWQRGWFMALAALAVSSIAWGVHRARVNRLLAIERVRTRIATDLHDDIGSSLSQIVILSEVAQQRALRGESVEPLQRIGGLSRELLESIGDIVWAIQPHKDHLSDLKKRMRHFATEVLSARNVELHWPADEIGRDMELNTEVRREVYLIFKEAINNIARHSRATEARISLRVAERQLTLEVTDNGMGIERFGEDEGNGLRNMKLRAASIKGELQVCSGNGQGTTVVLRVSAGLRLPT